VRLAGLILTFGADDVLDIRELEQIAQLGRVDDVAGGDGELPVRRSLTVTASTVSASVYVAIGSCSR